MFPWQAPLIVAGLFALAFLGAILKALVDKLEGGTLADVLTRSWDPWVLVPAGLLGLSVPLSKYVAEHLLGRSRKESVERLAVRLSEIEQETIRQPGPLAAFIEDLATRLRVSLKPRILLVDNFERLDLVTAAVIERYFHKGRWNLVASEFWVIFECQDGQSFSGIMETLPKSRNLPDTKYFNQLTLTQEQRRKLAEQRGRPDAWEFTAVKWVCGISEECTKRFRKLFREHRRDHPHDSTRYGTLELLYFLSLTARPGSIELGYRFLREKLTQKSLLRTEILPLLLNGTVLTVSEFQLALSQMEGTFASALELRGKGEGRNLRVTAEAADVLEKQADQLNLPNPELGHLYWSLFWYDYLQNRLPAASYVRKLSYHARRSDVSLVSSPSLRSRLASQQFDILLFCVGACLSTCLFAEVPFLLKSARLLWEEEREETRRDRLFRRHWEAYSVLGDEEILESFLQMADTAPEEQEPLASQNSLDTLFFDSLAIPPSVRRSAIPSLLRRITAKSEDAKSVADYVRTVSAWLAVSLCPSLPTGGSITLGKCAVESVRFSEEAADAATRRIEGAGPAGPRWMDLLTLPLSLWCMALYVEKLPPKQKPILLDSILLRIEAALSVAGSLYRQSWEQPGTLASKDLLLRALSRQLCALSLAAMQASYRLLMRTSQGVEPTGTLEFARKILVLGQAIVRFEPPLSTGSDGDTVSDEQIEQVDRLLAECGIIWDQFALEQMHHINVLVRLHFNSVVRGSLQRDGQHIVTLLKQVSPLLKLQQFTGLMACAVLADCYRSSAEMSAHFVCEGSRIALSNPFGPRLKQELSLLALYRSHALNFDVRVFLRELLAAGPEGDSYLERYWASVPAPQLHGHVLRLLNATTGREDAIIENATDRLIARVSEKLPGAAVKREIAALLDLFRLMKARERGETVPKAEVLLQHWAAMKQSWMYASVINLLLEVGQETPEVLGEAYSLLDRRAEEDSWNTYLFLAMTLANIIVSSAMLKPGNLRRVVAYLDKGIEKWESDLTAESNVRAYYLLMKLDPQRHGYCRVRIHYWEKIRIERDHVRWLRILAEKEQFLLIFREYWETARYWGLSCDQEPETVMALLQADAAKRKAILQEWRVAGGQVPDPFVEGTGGKRIASQFLYVGHYLFTPPADIDPGLEDARRAFDLAAKSALPELRIWILRLPGLDPEVRDLLTSYSERLFCDAGLPLQ